MRYLFGIFCILHGAIYAMYYIPNPDPKWPFRYNSPWLQSKLGTKTITIGKAMSAATVGLFAVGGLALIIAPTAVIWQTCLSLAAGVAIVFQILYWNKQLILGFLINLLILYGILIANWTYK